VARRRAGRRGERSRLPRAGSDDDLETAMCWNAVVPARIRANLAAAKSPAPVHPGLAFLLRCLNPA